MAKSRDSSKGTGRQRIETADEFSTFALEEAEDNRILRASMWFAAVFHAVLLLINFPAFEGRPVADPGDRVIYAYKIKQYRPPPPMPEYIPPKQQVKRVPAPDPTPHDPEPIRLDEPDEVVLPEVDTDYFVIPSAPPPPPEPKGPIHLGGEVIKPVRLHTPQPVYPERARRPRIQGKVILQAIIDKNGDVTDVKLIKGLPMGLNEAAIDAVSKWKFKPATLRGKPVAVYYNLTIFFHLQ